MTVIHWSPHYELGIDIIDQQHKHLVEIINKLLDSFNKEAELDVIKEVLKELKEYGQAHFKTEENYFDQFGFEGADEHKAEHHKFAKQLDALTNDLEKGSTTVPTETLDLLGNWFSDHEQDLDRKYVKCFKENGL